MACASGSQRGYPATRPPVASSDSSRIDDPIQVLRSRSPGLSVTRTADGGIAVQLIQPPTTANAGGMPLYLLDDAPFRAGPNGELIGLNPNDIESIKVLRKPDETAFYGIRGANGVILIKTKRPGR
jgi:TonB-dependent SusC/RagA subfamily outer membrane receptor